MGETSVADLSIYRPERNQSLLAHGFFPDKFPCKYPLYCWSADNAAAKAGDGQYGTSVLIRVRGLPQPEAAGEVAGVGKPQPPSSGDAGSPAAMFIGSDNGDSAASDTGDTAAGAGADAVDGHVTGDGDVGDRWGVVGDDVPVPDGLLASRGRDPFVLILQQLSLEFRGNNNKNKTTGLVPFPRRPLYALPNLTFE